MWQLGGVTKEFCLEGWMGLAVLFQHGYNRILGGCGIEALAALTVNRNY